jgi:hypothetical protein
MAGWRSNSEKQDFGLLLGQSHFGIAQVWGFACWRAKSFLHAIGQKWGLGTVALRRGQFVH